MEKLNNSKRAVVLVGAGVRLSNAQNELLAFVKEYKVPIVYSLMGKDAISEEYTIQYGSYWCLWQ
ncbi:MAG: hypothetical protein Q9M40_12165 [Sulfurimonas sp.]|nr:hypothetical protein [Sulfurimonas sp.]